MPALAPCDDTHKRPVVFVMWSSMGHLYAAFGLARCLQRLGHAVRFTGPRAAQEAIEQQGFEFIATPVLELLRMPIGIRRRPLDMLGTFSIKAWRSAIRDARSETAGFLASLGRVKSAMSEIAGSVTGEPIFIFDPFLLIYAIPLMAAAKPVVALSTKPLATPDATVAPYSSDLQPRDALFGIRVRLAWARRRLLYAGWELWERLVAGTTYRGLVLRFARECGLVDPALWRTRPIPFDLRLNGCPEWVLHARAFDFPRRQPADGDARHLGPCVDLARREAATGVVFDPEKPLVVFMLSTVEHRSRLRARRKLIETMLEVAWCNPDRTFLLSVGHHAKSLSQVPMPGNVILVSHAPSLSVLPHARVLVCQAGANIVKEAAWFGTRMVLLPDRADQPGNAARAVYHGLGRQLSLAALTASGLSRTIGELLADTSTTAALGKMQREFQNYGDEVVQRAVEDLIDAKLLS